MPDRPPHSLPGAAWRFAAVGAANTLLTGALLAVLATIIDPRWAYAVVFAVGLLAATLLAGPVVYRVRLSAAGRTAYALLYLVVFGIGLLVVDRAVRAGLPAAYSGLVVLVTAPLTFAGGRLLTQFVHTRASSDSTTSNTNGDTSTNSTTRSTSTTSTEPEAHP